MTGYWKLAAAASVALMTSGAGTAHAATSIDATGTGWCIDDGSCNNTDRTTIANNFGGTDGDGPGNYFHNWFSFDVPTGTYSSATLSVYNTARNQTALPASSYNLFNGSAITYQDLTSGPVLGSVNVASADTGVAHYVDIALNSEAIQRLNGAAGGSFLFGGTVDDYSARNNIFGYGNGMPVAYLTLTPAAVSAVPEPASWAMMIVGFGVIGGQLRRARRARLLLRAA